MYFLVYNLYILKKVPTKTKKMSMSRLGFNKHEKNYTDQHNDIFQLYPKRSSGKSTNLVSRTSLIEHETFSTLRRVCLGILCMTLTSLVNNGSLRCGNMSDTAGEWTLGKGSEH